MSWTIKDVAKYANVSTATVSRIINNYPRGYSEETKQTVLKVIEELGYQPNAVARGLVCKRTQTIGVLVPNVSNMFASEVLNGIEDVAHSLEHSVIVCNTDSNGSRTMEYLRVLREKRVDGIIFTSEVLKAPYYEAVRDMDVPIVLVSTISQKHQVPYVKVDDEQATYGGTQYLIDRGHRRIAMLSGPKEDPIAGQPRVEGYQRALSANRIEVDPSLVFYGKDFGYHVGHAMLDAILKSTPAVTAVLASSDELAAGVLSRAYQLGVKVPDELSVLGFDNTKIAEMVTPPLTVIAQPLYEMGKTASKMLFAMLGGERIASQIIPFEIIERSTVATRDLSK